MSPLKTIGHDADNFWRYNSTTGLIDLSRGAKRNNLLKLETTTNPICVDPDQTALVIIDMQNLFLSPHLRPTPPTEPSAGEIAAKALLDTGIPAARAHGIRIVWLNWGLSEEDLRTLPPAVMRTFGIYDPVPSAGEGGDLARTEPQSMLRVKNPKSYKDPGVDLGPVDLGDGLVVDGGRLLMRDSWNCALYGPLEEEFQRGASQDDSTARKKDVLVCKNRTSGLWGPSSEFEEFLTAEGITSLLFAGVNTDQCVGGTLMDAFNKGYDCILLRDGAATSSPSFADQSWHYNTQNVWGFVTTTQALMGGKVVNQIE